MTDDRTPDEIAGFVAVAHHGMSEAEVLAALREYNEGAIQAALEDFEATPGVLPRDLAPFEQFVRAHCEKKLAEQVPNIMKNMAISAGAARLH